MAFLFYTVRVKKIISLPWIKPWITHETVRKTRKQNRTIIQTGYYQKSQGKVPSTCTFLYNSEHTVSLWEVVYQENMMIWHGNYHGNSKYWDRTAGANSADPDQTALRAVWSGSALLAILSFFSFLFFIVLLFWTNHVIIWSFWFIV